MPQSIEQFRVAYGKMVAATWKDPKLAEKLKKSPAAILKEYGIEIPAKANIRVVQVVPTGHGDVHEQYADVLRGQTTGHIDIWLPTKPTGPGIVKLPGSTLGGGVRPGRGGAVSDVNTTCTPCCCCT